MTSSKTVKQWFAFSARDLRLAGQSLALSSEFKNTSAFLAQQAAEKAVKGFLAFHRIRAQKTHDMKRLAEEVASVDVDLAQLVRKGSILSKYAVEYRYPSESKRPLTVAMARTAIKKAQSIYDECFDRVYGAK